MVDWELDEVNLVARSTSLGLGKAGSCSLLCGRSQGRSLLLGQMICKEGMKEAGGVVRESLLGTLRQ